MKKKVALFDVDGTIFRGSLLIEHFKKMITAKYLPMQLWESKVKDKYLLWNHRETKNAYEDYMTSVALSYIEGLYEAKCSYYTIEKLASEVVEEKWKECYRYTIDRIMWHKQNNYDVILVSGSPDFLVSKFAKKLNCKYYATEYIFEENLFSGKTNAMWNNAAKQEKVRKIMKEYDFKDSYAYGDTISDIPMLKAVEYPIMINPNQELLSEKDSFKNLSIIVERKNMIYNIKNYTKEELKCSNTVKN